MHQALIPLQTFNFSSPYDNSGQPNSATLSESERGIVASIRTGNGPFSMLLSTAAIQEVPAVGVVAAGIENIVAKAAAIFDETKPDRVAERFLPLFKTLQTKYRAACFSTRKQRDLIHMERRSQEQPSGNYDPLTASNALIAFEKLTHREKLSVIETLPPYAVEAIKRVGQELSGLSVDEFVLINRRMRHLNILKAIGSDNASFMKTPTADDPAAGGVDFAKVDAHVADLDRIHAARVHGVESAKMVLRDTVVFTSVALNMSTDDAFELLTTGTTDAAS